MIEKHFLFIKKGHSMSPNVTFLFTDSLFLRYIFCFSNLILPKFGINANITKMLMFDDLKFDLVITLTYVLIDNFCPCFIYTLMFRVTRENKTLLARL